MKKFFIPILVIIICLSITILFLDRSKEVKTNVVFNGQIIDSCIIQNNESTFMLPFDMLLSYIGIDAFQDYKNIRYFSYENNIYKIDSEKDTVSINGIVVSKWSDYTISNEIEGEVLYIAIDDFLRLFKIKHSDFTYTLRDDFLYIEYDPDYNFEKLGNVNVVINGKSKGIIGYKVRNTNKDNIKTLVPLGSILESCDMEPYREDKKVTYVFGDTILTIDLSNRLLLLNGDDFLKYYENYSHDERIDNVYQINKSYLWEVNDVYIDVKTLNTLLNTILIRDGSDHVHCTYEVENSLQLIVSVRETFSGSSYPNLYINGRKTDIDDCYTVEPGLVIPLGKVLPMIGFRRIHDDGELERYTKGDRFFIIDYKTQYIYFKGWNGPYLLDNYSEYNNRNYIDWKNDIVYIDLESFFWMTRDSGLYLYSDEDDVTGSAYLIFTESPDPISGHDPFDYIPAPK